MNYNFNSQFPFPWSAGHPYLANGFPGVNNAMQHGLTAPASQSPFNQIAQPSGQPTQGYNTIMTAGVRFPTGVYPFGSNDTFPTTNSFPVNWNFSYNAIQSHGDPQGQIANQTPVQTIPVVQPATAVQSVQMPQSVSQMGNSIVQEIAGNGQMNAEKSVSKELNGDLSDVLAQKVSSLLAHPKVLKSALSKLTKVPNSTQVDSVLPSSISSTDSVDTTTICESDTTHLWIWNQT